MSCKYNYKGEFLTEKELINVLSQDQSIVDKYKPQEERLGGDYEQEDIDTFNKKVDALKKTMNVEVIFDEDVNSSRVLGKGDKRTEEAGKPVILINPNKIFKTTAIHEFGHVFIDSFPKGLDNPRIIRALKQLEGTELERKVKETYPDLSEDMLKKEILTTAIGSTGSRIWDSAENMSKWESFVAWFSDFITRTFGLERNEVESLAKELLDNRVKKISASKLESIAQEMRPLIFKKGDKGSKTKEEKEIQSISDKVNETYEDVLARVKKIYARQKEQGSSKASKEREKNRVKKGKVTRLSSIKMLQDELDKFDEADKKKGFIKYLEWTKGELSFMNDELEKRKNKDKINDNTVSKAIEWNYSFNMLNNLQNLLENDRKDKKFFSEDEILSFTSSIEEMKGMQSSIESKLLTYSRDLYARKLADNDTNTEERAKAQYKKEWKELEDAGGSGFSEGEYIIRNLQKDKELIDDMKMDIAKSRSKKAIASLSKLSMVMLSEKDMKSKDIAMVSNMLDGADNRTQIFATEEATEMDKSNKDFTSSSAKDSDSRNMKKKYKGMFVTTKSGQSYYTGKYSPEFLEEKQKINNESYDADIFDEKFKNTQISKSTKLDKNQNKVEVAEYESNIVNPNTGKKILGSIDFSGSKNIKVEGLKDLKEGERPTHVTYEVIGFKGKTQVMRISINEAIARSEAYHWNRVNTVKQNGIRRPASIWESKEYKDLEKNDKVRFDLLNDLRRKNREADKRYDKRDSIITKTAGTEFQRLHGVMKSSASRVVEGQSVSTMGKAELSKLIETQADEFDTQSIKQYTDFTNEETMRVPSPYRAKLKESDQSFDLHTMVLMNSIMSKNYQEKKSIESAITVIKEVVKNKQYPKTDSITGKQKIDAQNDQLQYETGGVNGSEYRKILSMTENRLYGITSKQAGGVEINGNVIEAQKVVQTGLKYFGTVSLVFNYANSIVNTGTGTFSNLIEAVGGDVYNLSDYRKAQKIYASDLKEVVKDMGSNIVSSRTNLLQGVFNTMGPDHINNDFEQGSRVEKMAKMSSLRPFATMGEHMMQSKVMYAILESIKVQNDKGQWLNSEAKVVKNKKEAASLNDMITFKTDKKGRRVTDLHKSVKNTSFTTTGKQKDIMLETRNLIRSKVDELHGQYTSDIQADAQRYMVGKMGFFLRKWMIPGFIRRYRGISNSFKPSDAELREQDEFYSQDQKNNMEGYYVSTARFVSKMINDAKEDQFNVIKSWGQLTTKQKSGVRKTMMDVGLMVSIGIAYSLLEGSMDDDDEVFWYYVLRRQQSELTFFSDPTEAFKVAQTPTAAVGNLKQIMKTINYMRPSMWGEEYTNGKYKGDSKLFHAAKKLLPRFKNSEDFKQSLEFLTNMNM
jgi:hypothetical protein